MHDAVHPHVVIVGEEAVGAAAGREERQQRKGGEDALHGGASRDLGEFRWRALAVFDREETVKLDT